MIITTKEVNEVIEMLDIIKQSATHAYLPGEHGSTILKGINPDSVEFVVNKAIAMLKEF